MSDGALLTVQTMQIEDSMTSASGNLGDQAGQHRAASPFAKPAAGWKHVLQRSWQEASEDNIGLAAAGVAFYGFLAIVPLLGAIVLSYGLIAEPSTVIKDIGHLASVMPGETAKLIGEQLLNVVKTSGTRKGFGLLLALALALFGARNGAGAVITALNIAYEEKETRSFIRLNLLALAITTAAVIIVIVALIAIAALGHLVKLIPGASGVVLVLGKILTFVMVGLGGAAGAATLYRYAPNNSEARWVWLTPGSAVVAMLWLLLTIGFGIYVADLGNYNATYGSLGAVAVTLTWLYLSSYVLLLGAELNSELDHEAKPDASASTEASLGQNSITSVPTPVSDHEARSRPYSPEPDILMDFALWRAGRRARRIIGHAQVGLAPSLLAIGGLALLKRRGRATVGFALLAAGGLMALFSASPGPEQYLPLPLPKARKLK